MSASLTRALGLAAIVYALMLAEMFVSLRHERRLRAQGAMEPADDVYPLMRIAYPLVFAGPLLEGWWRDPRDPVWWAIGGVLFAAGKGLKYWAIASLGPLWSFRVLVVPGIRLVTAGPYRFMRHPNYVGLVGEILGVAVMMTAPIAGTAALAVFGALLWKRVQVEERALATR